MILFTFLSVCVALTCGFLFDTSTPKSSGSGLSDKHYYDLMDLIMEERRSRRQIENYITGHLQQELGDMKNESATLKDKYQTLLMRHAELETKLSQIQNESGSKLEIQKIHSELNQSREENDRKFQILKNYAEKCFSSLNMTQNEILMNITSIQQQVNNDNEMVALTACGGLMADRYHKYMKFPDIKTSYGFNNLTTLTTSGQFTCEKPGLYLIITSIMAFNSFGRYNMFKQYLQSGSIKITHLGSVLISPRFSKYDSQNPKYHTGTGAAVVQLNVNDKIYVELLDVTKTYSSFNCMSIVKLQ